MPAGLPLDGSGDVVSTIVLGNTRLSYRLYYTYGPNPGWLVDFSDAEGNEVATGIRLCNGSVNMMKGYADFFKGQELLCITALMRLNVARMHLIQPCLLTTTG